MEQVQEKPKIGDIVLNKYKLLEELGKGGFGIVYKVLNTENQQEYALKYTTHKDQQLHDKYYKREKDSYQNFKHDGIIKMIEGEFLSNNQFYKGYFILELCTEGCLEKVIKKNKSLSQQQSLLYLQQVTEILKHIHEEGFMHRDLKPANILLKGDKIKIGDFGLAKQEEIDPIQKKKNTKNAGTKQFWSPQIQKEKDYTKITDIYSLGVVFYIMLKGLSIFKRNKFQEEDKDFNDDIKNLILQMTEEEESDRITLQEILEKIPQILQKVSQVKKSNLLDDSDDDVQYNNTTENTKDNTSSINQSSSNNCKNSQFQESSLISNNVTLISDNVSNLQLENSENI